MEQVLQAPAMQNTIWSVNNHPNIAVNRQDAISCVYF